MPPSTHAPRILVLCPYPPGTAGSQRFRFEQYLEALTREGFEVVQEPFWDEATWEILYRKGHRRKKVLGTLRGLARRLRPLLKARSFDYVFIHLEACPIGPPLVEAALFALGTKVIFDIDDAIYLPATSRANRLAAALRWRSKVAWTARRSHRVIAVNDHIKRWASQYSDRVVTIPTTIDPNYHRPRPQPTERAGDDGNGRSDPEPATKPVIGWTGTRSTLPYLELALPALKKLQREREFTLEVIADVAPEIRGIDDLKFVPWSKESEVSALQDFDIGLMPVPDTEWVKGKVGFKAIQYSAVGVPCVTSNVGAGPDVVRDQETGFVVENSDDAWVGALRTLIDNPDRRIKMGAAAREHVLRTYSVPSQTSAYLELFS